MKFKTLLIVATLICGASLYAQSPVAVKEESTVQVAPIVATVDGFDCGITVVNVTQNELTVTNFQFYSLNGTGAVGPEAAQSDQINRKLANMSFTIPGSGRFSMLASQLLGLGVNGQLRFSIIGNGAKKALSYQAILDPNFTTDSLPTEELTSRERSPRS